MTKTVKIELKRIDEEIKEAWKENWLMTVDMLLEQRFELLKSVTPSD